ncbi:hypothetical protein QPL79_03155 [Ignisphaera sp. 4213-co]|uniref:Uncharacterized protein n=1 Tax=Ignisphaera cupida TaxID=3050454 RepID=A0ABD4Z7S7_9CREN|nr:hypothetical protein [Ignisphaera sp. 4213-co]MDK6028360.1 hypothetical protein [Ignisphaera sp. 4213-co]
MSGTYKEKMRIFIDFCLKNIEKYNIDQREFYYIWRYIVIELGEIIRICNADDVLRNSCKEIDLSYLHTIVNRLLYAQYSSISNEEIIALLQKLCKCIKDSWIGIERKLEIC